MKININNETFVTDENDMITIDGYKIYLEDVLSAINMSVSEFSMFNKENMKTLLKCGILTYRQQKKELQKFINLLKQKK